MDGLFPRRTRKISVTEAMKYIFKVRKPEKLWVNKGKELHNKDVKFLIELNENMFK